MKREFIRTRKSDYTPLILTDPNINDEITVYVEDGDSEGEIWFQWDRFSGPSMTINASAWPLLKQIQDLCQQLADAKREHCSADDVAKILSRCGIRDATPAKP